MIPAPAKDGPQPALASAVHDDFDAQTLDACRRGERDALERVLKAHGPVVERTLARLCGPNSDLDDVLQETFTIACRSFKNFRGDSSVRTWLIGIAVRVASDDLRKPHRRRVVQLYAVRTEPVDPNSSADAQIDGKLLLERVYAHLDSVAVKKRQAFLLHVADGRTIAEIAQALGVNPLTVKSRIQFARRELMLKARRDPALSEFLASMHKDAV